MLRPHYTSHLIEAGCDEVGRGCLAGPVVAAAVILPKGYQHALLKDSKQLSKKQRLLMAEMLREKALAWAIGTATPQEVDQYNVAKASFLAMHRALDQLTLKPALILVDGNRFVPYPAIPHQCIVRGDSLYSAIAAASVLAKVHRDAYMQMLAQQFSQYGWQTNMGYPSPAHKAAIRKYSVTVHHRKTFRMPQGED